MNPAPVGSPFREVFPRGPVYPGVKRDGIGTGGGVAM